MSKKTLPKTQSPKRADPSGGGESRPSPEAAGKHAPQHAPKHALEPGLYVVATPIGNLRDITLRALDVLASAHVIFAEDTRITRKLLSAHGISARLEPYHEHNAAQARPRVLKALEEGQVVALATDAGTPLVSDPGFKLVRATVEAGHRVIPIPGASAPLAALAGAGLPSDRFLFAGFTPTKSKARREMFAELATTNATLIFFETGPRLAESLADMAAVFGAREAVVARELTKLFEEFRRDDLPALAAAYASADTPKGEIVVLIGPPGEAAPASAEALDDVLRKALKTMPVKDAAHYAAETLGVQKRTAYARALDLKNQ